MTQAVFGVFVAVAAVCALIATVAARRCFDQLREVRQLCTALGTERGRIAAHDAELDQITETLRKLSGRIGAVRKEARKEGSSGEPDEVQSTSRLTWKAQMREKYGLVPTPR